MQGTARELLTDPDEEANEEAQDVAGFLRSLLADGPLSAKAIYKDADGAGYSRDQIKRASLKLGIEKRKPAWMVDGCGHSRTRREREGSRRAQF